MSLKLITVNVQSVDTNGDIYIGLVGPLSQTINVTFKITREELSHIHLGELERRAIEAAHQLTGEHHH